MKIRKQQRYWSDAKSFIYLPEHQELFISAISKPIDFYIEKYLWIKTYIIN